MLMLRCYLYILNAVRCPYVRSSVTLGVASSGANDVIMIIMIIAGLWRYGDWRHVATGCSDLVTSVVAVCVCKMSREDRTKTRSSDASSTTTTTTSRRVPSGTSTAPSKSSSVCRCSRSSKWFVESVRYSPIRIRYDCDTELS